MDYVGERVACTSLASSSETIASLFLQFLGLLQYVCPFLCIYFYRINLFKHYKNGKCYSLNALHKHDPSLAYCCSIFVTRIIQFLRRTHTKRKRRRNGTQKKHTFNLFTRIFVFVCVCFLALSVSCFRLKFLL